MKMHILHALVYIIATIVESFMGIFLAGGNFRRIVLLSNYYIICKLFVIVDSCQFDCEVFPINFLTCFILGVWK